MPAQILVAYTRASTAQQVLGLEIQRNAIDRYRACAGAEVVAWYQDIGTASRGLSRLTKDQPALGRALAHARSLNANLIAARLDRLTRSTAILAEILESGP